MKLFQAAQIREIDQYTIENESIRSLDLMERAAQAFYRSFSERYYNTCSVAIIAGRGNNGGDALAIARILCEHRYKIQVFAYKPEFCKTDVAANLLRLSDQCISPIELLDESQLSIFDVIIDGVLGTGVSYPLKEIDCRTIKTINAARKTTVSIDIPSGLSADTIFDADKVTAVCATETITFQFPKIACLFADNDCYTGDLYIVDIGLSHEKVIQTSTDYYLTEHHDIVLKKRARFSHKGTYGHVLVAAGSLGKMGAAILAAKAVLKSGAGLVTVHIPMSGVSVMQSAFPEAMVSIDSNQFYITAFPEIDSTYNTALIGPGIGTMTETQTALLQCLQNTSKSLVIDADGLNCISMNEGMLSYIPKNSILTPHPKEFDRLFGSCNNACERIEKQKMVSKQLSLYIVLKGRNSSISTPNGEIYFNPTGNAGMATAGSGDVLGGIIVAFLSQAYSPFEAAVYGTYLHGLAGDYAAHDLTEESVTASDIISYLPKAIKSCFRQ